MPRRNCTPGSVWQSTWLLRLALPGGLDMTALTKACVARNEAVQAAIPARQLLVYQVKEAWEPLCAFLEVPLPDGPVSAH